MLLSHSLEAFLIYMTHDTSAYPPAATGTPTSWLQLIPLLIALLAVFFGPLIQLYLGNRQIRVQLQIAHEQVRASVRSTNRQQWIHILRDQLSEFAAEIGGLMLLIDKDGNLSNPDAYPSKVEKLLYLQCNIRLLLNPDKQEHKDLINFVDQAGKAAINREVARVESAVQGIIIKSQELFKHTWERIKQLD